MKEKESSFFYPPGGILIWIIILVETLTFFMGIGSLMYEKSKNLNEFIKMQSVLNENYAIWNTVFLISSGFFMALTVHFHKQNMKRHISYSLILTIFLGFLFLFLKSFEYIEKWNAGYTIQSGDFFAYYWLLTGFHFIHVLVGFFILIYIFIFRNNIILENLEAGASFWHMCDLIWVFLFPSLYLVR